MAKDEIDLLNVECLLKNVGLQVARVPETQARRCDLSATDAGERYLFEVKGFHDDEAIASTLKEGRIYERTSPFDYSNSVVAAIRDAVDQLRETLDQTVPELRIICLISRNKYDGDLVRQQITSVIHGTRSVLCDATNGVRDHLQCLYFDESAFFRHRNDLDAVIVIQAEGCTFFANDHSPNIERVRCSALGLFFASEGAFYDARISEEQGWLVADCAINRTDVQSVLRYVEKKYGLRKPILMQFKRFSGVARVPWS
jgi:hypothetical protein